MTVDEDKSRWQDEVIAQATLQAERLARAEQALHEREATFGAVMDKYLGNTRELTQVLRQQNYRLLRLQPWAALGMVLVVGVGLALLYEALKPAWLGVRSEYETAIGEVRTVRLDDGSEVVLDTDSKIVARYFTTRRSVELVRGQAKFDVATHPDRPFHVSAVGVTITARGTAFLVRIDADPLGGATMAVTLLHGQVAVERTHRDAPPQPSILLSAGQRIRFDRDGQYQLTEGVDTGAASLWTGRMISADGWTLAQLVDELNRYGTTQIHFLEPSVGKLTISGHFPAGDPVTAIKVLERSLPVRAWPGSRHDILLTHMEERP